MKSWLPILLLATCLISMAACSGDDDDDTAPAPGDDDDDTGDDDDDTGDDDTGPDENPDIAILDSPQDPYPDGFDFDESPEGGPLREKVIEYDLWHEAWHQPFYGATVGVYFADDERTEPIRYFDTGDSCIWSGTYLASQSFRYAMTGDEQAKANAIRTAEALSGNLHVTGRPGFIARYRGPQDPTVIDTDCDEDENCHVIDDGEFAGDFWKGNTSRDQYTGWFFGMAIAYDLIDDEPTRAMIRADVAEVLAELIRENWRIIDADGRMTTAGPQVLAMQQVTWSLIGYHMTGQGLFKRAVQRWLEDANRPVFELSLFNFFNRYSQYYGNNLGHQNFYSLLRLARVYVNEADYDYFVRMFETKQHTFTRLSHNAFFTEIFMSQGLYEPEDGDPYQAQLVEDLTDFRPAPNYRYATTPPEAPLDPLSVFFADLWDQYPIFEELMGDVDPQAEEAYRVPYQCSTDFLWQRNPFNIECGGVENVRAVNPGVDYLVGYWMAAFHGYLGKEQ